MIRMYICYDYIAYTDYTDLDIRGAIEKAILNHSVTRLDSNNTPKRQLCCPSMCKIYYGLVARNRITESRYFHPIGIANKTTWVKLAWYCGHILITRLILHWYYLSGMVSQIIAKTSCSGWEKTNKIKPYLLALYEWNPPRLVDSPHSITITS